MATTSRLGATSIHARRSRALPHELSGASEAPPQRRRFGSAAGAATACWLIRSPAFPSCYRRPGGDVGRPRPAGGGSVRRGLEVAALELVGDLLLHRRHRVGGGLGAGQDLVQLGVVDRETAG